MPYSTGTAEVLTRAVQLDAGPGARELAVLDATAREELPLAAYFHGIGAYVYEYLRAAETTDVALLGKLKSLRDRNGFAHLRSLLDVRFLEEALGGADIPWLVFKGPTLAAPVHGAAHLRSYADLDALVPARDLGRTLDALTANGATIRDRNWTLIHREMKGEVHVGLPSGTSLDLHWHLLNEPGRRNVFPIDIDELFDRSAQVDVDGASVQTLGAADNLVYIALHTIHSGGHRLIWLKDFERLLAQPGLDVDEVARRATEWNAELVLRAALLRAELALGYLPLAAALRSQLPRAALWEPVARRAWRAAPAASEDGTGSIGRIFARSVRTTQLRTFGNLAGRTLRHLRERGGTTVEEVPRHFSADDPRSDRFPAGGEAELQAYLTAVAAAYQA